MPPDRFVFDLNAPYPDVALDTMRQAMVQALADLTDHVKQLADAFLVGQTAADGLGIALTNFGALQTAVTGNAAQITALTDRVTTLEAQVAALQSPPPTTP